MMNRFLKPLNIKKVFKDTDTKTKILGALYYPAICIMWWTYYMWDYKRVEVNSMTGTYFGIANVSICILSLSFDLYSMTLGWFLILLQVYFLILQCGLYFGGDEQ